MSGPAVTVAIPVLNEADHIDECMRAVLAQDYQGPIEILVLDGGSEDRTRELASSYPRVRVIDNPKRVQAAALNLALELAAGEILVRVDGHCVIAPDYVTRCLEALRQTEAAMVGGGLCPRPGAGFSGVAAVAMSSAVGAGPARFHRPGARAGFVDTVYLGAYRVQTARSVGGYDERLATNEDAEFAWRMGAVGGVWFDPNIRSSYRPRATLSSMARQFFRYGSGRAVTVARHPRSLAARQLAAPLLLVGLLTPWRLWVAAAYALVLAAAALQAGRERNGAAVVMPLVVAVMHVSWGLGFLLGLPRAALWARRYKLTV